MISGTERHEHPRAMRPEKVSHIPVSVTISACLLASDAFWLWTNTPTLADQAYYLGPFSIPVQVERVVGAAVVGAFLRTVASWIRRGATRRGPPSAAAVLCVVAAIATTAAWRAATQSINSLDLAYAIVFAGPALLVSIGFAVAIVVKERRQRGR